MRARYVQIDTEYEDDGFYAVTFWLDADPPRYLIHGMKSKKRNRSVWNSPTRNTASHPQPSPMCCNTRN